MSKINAKVSGIVTYLSPWDFTTEDGKQLMGHSVQLLSYDTDGKALTYEFSILNTAKDYPSTIRFLSDSLHKDEIELTLQFVVADKTKPRFVQLD